MNYLPYLILIVLCEVSLADLWLFGDWARNSPPSINFKDTVSTRASSYRGNILAGIDARLDARWLELKFSARKAIFELDQTDNQVVLEVNDRINQFSFEIGRSLTSQAGYLGRMGMALSAFYPSSETFLQLHMMTGQLNSKPAWQLTTALFKGLTRTNDLISLAVDLWTPLNSEINLGIHTNLLGRLNDSSAPLGTFMESNLFGLGPWLQLKGDALFLRVGVNWHLRIESGSSNRIYNLPPFPDFELCFGGAL